MIEYARRNVRKLKDNPLYTRTVTIIDETGRSFLVCREEFDEYMQDLADQLELDIYTALCRGNIV